MCTPNRSGGSLSCGTTSQQGQENHLCHHHFDFALLIFFFFFPLMLYDQFECCGPYSLDEDGEDLRGAMSWDFYKNTKWYTTKSQSKLSQPPLAFPRHPADTESEQEVCSLWTYSWLNSVSAWSSKTFYRASQLQTLSLRWSGQICPKRFL